jgi:hypothetical protein
MPSKIQPRISFSDCPDTFASQELLDGDGVTSMMAITSCVGKLSGCHGALLGRGGVVDQFNVSGMEEVNCCGPLLHVDCVPVNGIVEQAGATGGSIIMCSKKG